MLVTVAIQIFLASFAFADVSEKIRLGLQPSSSNYPGLEAPLESAAASPQKRTIISNRNHDEDNLERLCNDPFHSFLCKPVTTRRRRINGRLRPGAVIPSGAAIPSGIVPEASNVQESSQPLESTSDIARKGKGYLPPSLTKAPKKLPEPQFLPPGTLNIERTQESKISYSTVPRNRNGLRLVQTEKTLKKIEDQPRTFGQKLRLEPDNTVKNSKQMQFDKLPRKYLPLDEAVSPDSSNISPSIQNLPLQGLAAQNKEQKDERHSLERLCNDPFHSFLCKPGKRRKRIDGRIRPEAKIPPGALIAASSIISESRVLPTQQRSARQQPDIRGVRENYLPPDQVKTQPTFQSKQGSSGYNYPKPNNGTDGYFYEKPSDSSSKPDITTESAPQNTLVTSSQTEISQDIVPPSTGYQYETPAIGLTVTTNSPLTTQITNGEGSSNQDTVNSGKEGYYYPKPSSSASTTVQVIQAAPDSTSSPQDTTNKPGGTVGGYNYPKPLNPLTLPSTTFLTTTTSVLEESATKAPGNQPTASDTQTTLVPSSEGYKYPKPTNNQESGYNYEKPSEQFTLPAGETNPSSNTLATETTPPPVSITTDSTGTTFGYQYPKPSDTQENIVSPNQTGYAYPKPSIDFTYPTTKRQDTTESYATSSGQAVATTLETSSIQNVPAANQTGYVYDKPPNPLALPTKNPSEASSINQDIVPPTQEGYVYDKPTDSTTAKPMDTQTVPTFITTINNLPTTTAQATTGGYQYPKPSNGQLDGSPSQNGYVYEKPDISFTLPDSGSATTTIEALQTTTPGEASATITTNLTTGYEYPNPSNDQNNLLTPPKEPGYTYPQPSTTFTLSTDAGNPTVALTTNTPTTTKPTTLQSLSTANVGKEQTGYNYQKPALAFTYPRPTFSTTSYTRPLNSFQYPKSSFTQNQGSGTQNGYVYQRPAAPTPATDLGYHYRWPGNPLTLPPRQRSARNYQAREQFPTYQFPSRRDYNHFTF